MNYVSAAAVSLVYTIPPLKAAKNAANRFHVEIHELRTNIRELVHMPTVVAAVAPVGLDPGTSGSATFASLPLVTDGLYILKVVYASNADLDAPSTTLELLDSVTVLKITATAALTV